tara:strand:- start:6436 stop:6585 length:150 start_codon:yes stop_codon:yes gene_type:complete
LDFLRERWLWISDPEIQFCRLAAGDPDSLCSVWEIEWKTVTIASHTPVF